MRLVVLESPYKGDNWEDTEENVRFGRVCMNDCLVNHNEAPFPSHLLYTLPGVLEDKIESERNLGKRAGFDWKARADASVIYVNRGISAGMHEGIRESISLKQDFEYRILSNYPKKIQPLIYTVTGASGVGKTTTLKLLQLKAGNMLMVPSFTSRSKRESDLIGEYRYNMPVDKFTNESEDFLWTVFAHGNHYGTLKKTISSIIENPPILSPPIPRFMTLIPDAVKILREYLVKKVKDADRYLLSFYLLSPKEKELRKRLTERGDSKASIRKRINDCKEWDSNALKSDIPYIFIQNSEDRYKIVQQVSLFL